MKKTIFAATLAVFGLMTSCSSSCGKATSSDLAGTWTITQIQGEEVKTENPVTIEFMGDNKIHAKLGCNILNSTFTFDEKEGTFKFAENGQRTMMMCPDMQTEDKMVNAIKEVAKISKCEEAIILEDANGTTLITMKK